MERFDRLVGSLGASSSDVLKVTMGQALGLTVTGLVIGGALGLALGRRAE